MPSFRFIHCADLHIDSPLRGLEADPDAPMNRIRRATRDAFTALVDYALDQQVDFVLAAGDLYDGDWQDWRTGRFLVGEVARLTYGCPKAPGGCERTAPSRMNCRRTG
jgi:exonuclease SbcD